MGPVTGPLPIGGTRAELPQPRRKKHHSKAPMPKSFKIAPSDLRYARGGPKFPNLRSRQAFSPSLISIFIHFRMPKDPSKRSNHGMYGSFDTAESEPSKVSEGVIT